jgi:PhoPQ-activated pathogenicity-related protein
MAATLSNYVYSPSNLPQVEEILLSEFLKKHGVSESDIKATGWASHSRLFRWVRDDNGGRYTSLSIAGQIQTMIGTTMCHNLAGNLSTLWTRH